MNKNNIITDWLDKNSNPEIEDQVSKNIKMFENNINTAKKYCKTHNVKLEDVRGNLMIYSVILNRKVGGKIGSDSYKRFKDWDIIKYRTAFLCKIEKLDVYHIMVDVGGKYHGIDTRFTISDELMVKVNE